MSFSIYGAPAAVRPGREPSRLYPALILGITGAGGVVLSWVLAHHSLLGSRWPFLEIAALWVPVWLAGSWAAGKLERRTSLMVVLGLTVLLRLAAASGPVPSVSNDLYRYAWDAHVQLAGVDPYRYAPVATQVTPLRYPTVWPSPAGCAAVGQHPGCALLNRANDRTIYPPVAEAWFVVVHVVTFGATGSRPWQLAAGLVDDLTVALLIVALSRDGRDPRHVAWYALSPLPVVELAGNGHVDGLALLFLVAAVLALRRDRRGWAGVLVGMATMVKLYPALAVVAWWRRGRWRLVFSAAAVCTLSYLPHVLAVGTKVLGYLPGYLKEEHYTSGTRFVLVSLAGTSGRVTTVLAAGIVVAAIAFLARIDLDPAVSLSAAMAVLILVTTPVQPWYAVTLAGIGVLAGVPWLVVLGLCAEPYYASVVLADPHQVAAGRVCYLVGLVVSAAGLVWDRRSRPDASRNHPGARMASGATPRQDSRVRGGSGFDRRGVSGDSRAGGGVVVVVGPHPSPAADRGRTRR